MAEKVAEECVPLGSNTDGCGSFASMPTCASRSFIRHRSKVNTEFASDALCNFVVVDFFTLSASVAESVRERHGDGFGAEHEILVFGRVHVVE
eukprot:5982649-Pleurochrysis_carterae.AAC.1